MLDVITIGSATRDIFLKSKHFKVDHLPLGSKVEVDQFYAVSGGSGTNTAVTFARQKYKTACVSVIGKDLDGSEIVRELHEEGVSTDYVIRHDDDNTALSVILVDPSGERTILSYKGEGQHFNAVNMPWSSMKSGCFYIGSLGGDIGVITATFQVAREQGALIAWNPGSKDLLLGMKKLSSLLEFASIVFMNKEEASALTGVSMNDWLGCARAIKKNIKGIVSISDGNNGVIVIDSDEKVYQAGVPNSPIIERTGAGDAFGSAFVAEFLRSKNIEKSIQYGTANASSVVTKFGGKSGILREGENGGWPLVSVSVI